ITGGPCAGKSEARKWIKDEFSKKGYNVLFIPETATELISGGVAPWTCGTNLDYQICQCKLQMFKEEIFDEAIHTMKEDKFLVVCDRGMFDNKAYMSEEEFAYILNKLNVSEDELNARYDAVFHLVTAAKGLESFYSGENNIARYETVEEAQSLDDRLLSCWSKHPHLKVIDNNENFDIKMNQLLDEINKVLEC
ncbi:MAG: ATP-binding protein, partial [Traorella sp.]